MPRARLQNRQDFDRRATPHDLAASRVADDGFPDGTNGCSCEHCYKGVTAPDSASLTSGQHCCHINLLRKVMSPWRDAPGEHDMLYIGGNRWLTEPWPGPECTLAHETQMDCENADGTWEDPTCRLPENNQADCEAASGTWNDPYCDVVAADETECDTAGGVWEPGVCTAHNDFRWLVTIDLTGSSYFELVLETDRGCPVPCIKYAISFIECQCDWQFTMLHNDADFSGVDRNKLTCNVCVKPTVAEVESCIAAISGLCGVAKACDADGWSFTVGESHIVFRDEDVEGSANCCATLSEVSNGKFGLLRVHPTAALLEVLIYGEEDYTAALEADAAGDMCLFNATELAVYTCCHIATCGSAGGPCGYQFEPLGSECPKCLRSVRVPLVSVSEGYPSHIGLEREDLGPASITSSGKCAGSPCSADETPADPSTGGCCVDGVWYNYFTETMCTNADGVWNGDEMAGEAACAVRGVCCLIFDGVAERQCIDDVTDDECDEANAALFPDSYFWTEDGECAVDCPPVGKCCTIDGAGEACTITFEATCTGVWTEGVPCSEGCDCCASASCVGGPLLLCEGLGACCVDGECFDGSSDAECTGTFFNRQRCSEVEPCPAAASCGCCMDPSTMSNAECLTEEDCSNMHPGWDWLDGWSPDGAGCQETPCGPC